MFSTTISPRLICLVGFVTVATATNSRTVDDGVCAAVPACSSRDRSDNQPFFENTFSRDVKVRAVNSSCISYYHYNHFIRRLQSSRIAHSPELALWMFIEFLKAAPLLMVSGCIMMIFVALGQKWFTLAYNEAPAKIRWTKPAAC